MSKPAQPEGLPASIHTEIAVLGACLLEPQAIDDAAARLVAEDFSLDSHQRVWRAIIAVRAQGMRADLTTVRAALERKAELSVIGGIDYLMHLTEGIPRNFSIDSYVLIVKEKSRLRQLMGIFYDAAQRSADPGEDATALQWDVEAQLAELEGDAQHPMQTAGQYLSGLGEPHAILEQLETRGGLKFGWDDFDEATGGLQRKELMILGAITSMGKSPWAYNAVYGAAVMQSKLTCLFPLEDKCPTAIRKMLASATGIEYAAIRQGTLSTHERQRLASEASLIAGAPLYIDDSHSLTMTRIKGKCAQVKRVNLNAGHPTGLDLILIDQLSHVEDGDVQQRNSTSEERIAKQGYLAKRMAEELDVPVVLLHQITQEAGKRADPRPKLTDLGGSGRLKNHADIVAFLHRPWYFDKGEPEEKGEIILAKNRQGRTTSCDLEWQPKIQRWGHQTLPPVEQERFDGY